MSTEEELQRYLDNDPQKPVNPVSAYLTPTLPDYLWKLVAFEEFLCGNQSKASSLECPTLTIESSA